MGRRGGFRKRKRVKGYHRVPVPLPDRNNRLLSTTPPLPNAIQLSSDLVNTSIIAECASGHRSSFHVNTNHAVKCCDIMRHLKQNGHCQQVNHVANMSSNRIYQFKIVLMGIKPDVWRRILVPYNFNFWDFHVAIQDAMGWQDKHVHHFEVRDIQSGATHLITADLAHQDIWEPDEYIVEDLDVFIYEYFTPNNNTAVYFYHVDDIWEHKIVFEGVTAFATDTIYPLCIGGKRACPIERTGSMWIYKEVLRALKAPNVHFDYCERFEKLIEDNANYKVDAFDVRAIKFNNAAEHWEKRYQAQRRNLEQYEDIEDYPSSEESDDESLDSGSNTNSRAMSCVSVTDTSNHKGNLAYEFKIVLKGSNPKIWRRIHVPSTYTFWDFHIAIQDAFGWKDSCAHFFEMLNVDGIPHVITIAEDESIWDMTKGKIPEEYTTLPVFFTKNNIFANYIYNMRAYWDHRIVLERILLADDSVKYPVCVGGKRACPPDSCPGIAMYEKRFSHELDVPRNKGKGIQGLTSAMSNIQLDIFDINSVKFTDPRERWKHGCLEDGDAEDIRDIVNPKYKSGNKNDQHVHKYENVYQFKVSLAGIKPTIWRRIQIPAKATFWELHIAIVDSVGYEHHGLHYFETLNAKTDLHDLIIVSVKNQPFNFPKSLKRRSVAEENTKLYSYFTATNRVAWYELENYDVWRHKVALEKVLSVPKGGNNYPACIDGRRACPIVGSGGNSGYQELLNILKNPQHLQHKERSAWLKQVRNNTPFNPDKFDPKLVTFNNPQTMLKMLQRVQTDVSEINQVCTSCKSKNLPVKPFIYQFKIVLQNIEPEIWRRIRVPGDFTFWQLHVAIQDAMGWKDIYPHQFEATDPKTHTTHIITLNTSVWDCGDTRIQENEAKLLDYCTSKNTVVKYDYDFSSDWEHNVIFEETLSPEPTVTYPVCLAGERACPIENCAGVRGYLDMLRIINNPDNRNRDTYLKWAEKTRGKFDSERFEPSSVNFNDAKVRWKNRYANNQNKNR